MIAARKLESTSENVTTKAQLRTKARALRNAISAADREAAEARITALAFDTILALKPMIVALYASVRSEVATGELARQLSAAGISLAFPRVIASSLELEFVISAPHELRPALLEIPTPTADKPAIALDEIECFVVPGLAFDATGNRLGYGRGCYDRTLTHNQRASRLGICFSKLLLSSLPHEPNDVAMTAIITEGGVIDVKRGT